jgi:S1-C subfamily serine protease
MFNLAGDIAGLVGADGRIEPITSFTAVIDSLFKFRAVRRPGLGFYYLPGSSLIGIDTKINEQFSGLVNGNGAVIVKADKGIAVVKGGPADLAGLKEGDIILFIDGNEISKDSNMTNIINTLVIGDKVIVEYQRAGVKKQVEVKVGELK